MKYYSLKDDSIININDDSTGLKFLYNNFFGRLCLKITISKPIRSIYSKYMCSKLSAKKISSFIKKNNINMDEYYEDDYTSFNDFFIRRIKEDKRKIDDGLFAIADSKLSVYEIDNNTSFHVKNSIYTVDELLGDDGSKYNGGYALVFRLCVDDYHHYVFPDSGKIIGSKKIKGKLHTVQPIAFKKYKVFSENSREITYLDTDHYGEVAYIEVGAMMIGKIVNEDVSNFKRGEEKGHFEFGGSTVILLFQKDKISINPKIIDSSKNGIETIVKLGNNIN